MAPRPSLRAHKASRMRASAFAFLRGSAPLFYEILKAHPHLARGPTGTGWIAGDLHLENFGVFRSEKGITFNLNDFDDTLVGLWRFDVLRLLTSLLLSNSAIAPCEALLEGHQSALFGNSAFARVPSPVLSLLRKVEKRSHHELLKRSTLVKNGHRFIVKDDRHPPLPTTLKASAIKAFENYVATFPARSLPDLEAFKVLDLTYRIAGTGSLGCLRMAVLVEGKGGKDGAWLFDMKEEGVPSASILFSKPRETPALRVIAGSHACLAHPPLLMGATAIGKRSMLVRRMTPQEDKLGPEGVDANQWEDLAHYLGGLTGLAHRKGASSKGKRWTKRERSTLISSAIELAGIHQATHWAYCQILGSRKPK